MQSGAIDVAIVIDAPDTTFGHYGPAYRVHYWPDAAELARRLASPEARHIRAVHTNGSFGLGRREMDALPALEIIAVIGSGYEGVDLAAARERGIVVTHGAGVHAAWVAEQAWALMLAAVRRIPACDRGVRDGRWSQLRGMYPSVTGRRLGIFGLGRIGREVAKRGEGFAMQIAHCSRTPRPDVPYRHFQRLRDLAEWCDVLVLCAPGGPQTRHAVDGDVLAALGPEGYLVNVARGTLVDNAALVAALRAGTIAGAGLDVVEGEPAVPPELAADERVVITPHVAGHTRDAMEALMRLLRANLDAHFAGKPVPTPVP